MNEDGIKQCLDNLVNMRQCLLNAVDKWEKVCAAMQQLQQNPSLPRDTLDSLAELVSSVSHDLANLQYLLHKLETLLKNGASHNGLEAPEGASHPDIEAEERICCCTHDQE